MVIWMARPLLAAFAVTLLVAVCASAQASDSRNAGGGDRVACDLSHLRVIQTDAGPGLSDSGTIEMFLYVRLVNDGRTCTITPKSGLRVAATGHVKIGAKLPLRRTVHLAPHKAVTLALGTWWRLRSRSECHSAQFASVVIHKRGSSKTVSLRHPFTVCTPAQSALFALG
jgi:hypothetical protein